MEKWNLIFKKIGAFIIDVLLFNISFFIFAKIVESFNNQSLYLRVPINPINPLSIDELNEIQSFSSIIILKLLIFVVLGVIFWAVIPIIFKSKSTIGMEFFRLEYQSYRKNKKISFIQVLMRYFSSFVSYGALGIGFLLGIFNNRGLTLHDLITKTIILPKER
ncbi:RDD family protein [Bacillus sp. THAF10]|uniref:RDD family protein n=1 Tax=Bacillus sp. THAF10 TaxID=2587848 RepID=UPI0012A85D1F|nr:RDD family protein [Bacillus sp. THAF10]QFT91119.1 RDD family protein [Bacillus sp. THAF10]